MASKLVKVEAVRGFAAVYVTMHHWVYEHPLLFNDGWQAWARQLFRFGQEAVIAFFLLSGFVIALSVEGRATFDLKRYLLDRAVRIYSVVVPSMVLLAVLAFTETGARPVVGPGEMIGNFLMLQDVALVKPAVLCHPLLGDTPLWSLHYEWWFYMLYPALLMRVPRLLQKHVVGVFGILAACWYVFIPGPASRLLMYFTIWWIGVEVSRAHRGGSLSLHCLRAPLLYLAFVCLPLAVRCVCWKVSAHEWSWGHHPFLELRHHLAGFVLVLAAMAWRQADWSGFAWTLQPFAWVAPVSFALYVLHYKTLATASYFRWVEQPLIEATLYAVVTLALCFALEAWFYPLMRSWLRRSSTKSLPMC